MKTSFTNSTTFTSSNARRGQGMVEFALAIPIFLLLVFGVFEFGRFLMTYSAVFSAAREAARYGSAVGTNVSNVPYDHDCAGMRAAAVRVGEVGGVRAELVRIRMLGMNGQPKLDQNGNSIGGNWCNTGFTNTGYDTVLGDQVEVTVAVNYAPVVPLVPIPSLTVNTSTFTGGINSVSARTIVKNVQALGVGAGSLTQKTLTVVMNPPDASGGWVTPNQGTYYYNPNDVVALTAMPVNEYWTFTWGGALSGNVTPTQVLMDDNKTVTVTFTRKQVTLAIDKVGMGTLKLNGTAITTPYQNIFDAGTTVQLEATPDTNWTFGSWSGGVTGTTNSVSLLLNANKSIVGTFTNTTPYTLNVNTALLSAGGCDNCTVTVNPQQATYHYGDVVTLTSNATLPWTLSSWAVTGATLSGSASSNPVNITIQGNTDVTASFLQPGYTLTVHTSAEGVLPYAGSTGGTVEITPFQSTYHYGDTVTIQAVPDEGMYFVAWTGSLGTDQTNPKVVTITGDTTMTANFRSGYVLNYTISPSGGGTVTGAPNNSLYSPVGTPTQVTLTATPTTGWVFSGWSGSVNSTSNPLTLTMDTDKILTASFTDLSRPTRTLTVNIDNQCGVAIDPASPWTNPTGATEITRNTQATLTATPPDACIFTGWSGGLTSTANPATVLMDTDKTVTATFTRKQVTLSLDVVFKDTAGQVITGVTGGSVKVNGTTVTVPYQGTFAYGTAVPLEAIPATYWDFTTWGGDLSDTTTPTSLTMNGNKTITATFSQKLFRLNLNVVLINASGQTLTGVNGGTVSVNGSQVSAPYTHTFAPDTVVNLAAAPAADWEFFSWSGSASGTNLSTQVIIDGDKTVTAVFALRQYTLDVRFAMPKSAKDFTNTVTVTITARSADGATLISTNTASFTDNYTGTTNVLTDAPFNGTFDAGTQITLQVDGTNAPGWTVNSLNIPLWSFDGGSTYPLTAASTVVTMTGDKTIKIKYTCVTESLYVSIGTECNGSPCYMDTPLSTGVNTYLTGLNLNLNLQNNEKQLTSIQIEPTNSTAKTTIWYNNPGLSGLGIHTVSWNTYNTARLISASNTYQLYFEHTAGKVGTMSINAMKFSNACR